MDVRQPTGLRPGVPAEKPDRGAGPGAVEVGGPGVEVLPPEEGGGKEPRGGAGPGGGGARPEREPGDRQPEGIEPGGPELVRQKLDPRREGLSKLQALQEKRLPQAKTTSSPKT